jgi:hypothetical protein
MQLGLLGGLQAGFAKWISDFVQNGMYPGPGYRCMHPAFKIYRMN